MLSYIDALQNCICFFSRLNMIILVLCFVSIILFKIAGAFKCEMYNILTGLLLFPVIKLNFFQTKNEPAKRLAMSLNLNNEN